MLSYGASAVERIDGNGWAAQAERPQKLRDRRYFIRFLPRWRSPPASLAARSPRPDLSRVRKFAIKKVARRDKIQRPAEPSRQTLPTAEQAASTQKPNQDS
jgi:hypothetical protein